MRNIFLISISLFIFSCDEEDKNEIDIDIDWFIVKSPNTPFIDGAGSEGSEGDGLGYYFYYTNSSNITNLNIVESMLTDEVGNDLGCCGIILQGDGEFQVGESLSSLLGTFGYAEDVGLDGLPNTNDYGEGDGIWQPGDGWIDVNGNGIVDLGGFGETGYDTYIAPDPNNYNDVWPLSSGILLFTANDEEFSFDLSDSYIFLMNADKVYRIEFEGEPIQRIIYNKYMEYFTLFGSSEYQTISFSSPNELIDYR